MAYARVSYTGDGSTKIFTVPFPYLSASYVEVRVAGVLKAVTTHYTWLTSSTIQFVTAPANGATIFILRNTPKESRLVNYQDAAILREVDLDLDSDQAFHIVQEALDASVNARRVAIFVGGVDYTAGVTTTLALGDTTVEEETLSILFDAAAQQHTEYSISSGVITFTSAIPAGVSQVEVAYSIPLATGLIDSSVTTPKLADENVTTSKLAPLAVTQDKLAQAVFKDLTAVVAQTTDYVAISDVSDSGNKKKTPVSDILSLIPYATTAAPGSVEQATNAEALGGTDNTRYVTSAGLASGYLTGFNGYRKLPGGEIVQKGVVNPGGDIPSGGSILTWTYPIAFPNAVWNVQATMHTSDAGLTRNIFCCVVNITLTQATFYVFEGVANTQSTWGIHCKAEGN
jgi:hypothetical protein